MNCILGKTAFCWVQLDKLYVVFLKTKVLCMLYICEQTSLEAHQLVYVVYGVYCCRICTSSSLTCWPMSLATTTARAGSSVASMPSYTLTSPLYVSTTW